MGIDWKDLGIEQSELVDRVVAKIAGEVTYNADAEIRSKLRRKVEELVTAQINAAFEKLVAPGLSKMIEEITLTKTSEWGEPKGPGMTFTEFLVARCEAYILEQVNHEGNSKRESEDGYSWRGTQTRLTHLIHKHLHYSVDSVVKAAMKQINESMGQALAETVKIKLKEAAEKMKVSVAL